MQIESHYWQKIPLGCGFVAIGRHKYTPKQAKFQGFGVFLEKSRVRGTPPPYFGGVDGKKQCHYSGKNPFCCSFLATVRHTGVQQCSAVLAQSRQIYPKTGQIQALNPKIVGMIACFLLKMSHTHDPLHFILLSEARCLQGCFPTDSNTS